MEAAATKLVFYPNPASEAVAFELGNSTSGMADCQVTDALGRVVLEQSIQVVNGKGRIGTKQLPSGSYAVQVRSGGKAFSGIFMKH